MSGDLERYIREDYIVVYHNILIWISVLFTIISILVIIISFCITLWKIISRKDKENISKIFRENFDNSLLMALQLLIVADIVDTIIAPDLITISSVLIVVIIRTVMSFSLNWEMKNERAGDDRC